MIDYRESDGFVAIGTHGGGVYSTHLWADPTGIEGYVLGAFPTYLYLDRDMKFYAGHVGFSDEYVREKIEEGL